MAATTGSVGQSAGLGSRIVAYIIDLILIGIVGGIVTVPVFFLIGLGGDSGAAGAGLALIVQGLFSLLVFAYWIGMEGLYGYTVGKKLMSIRVVGENGGQIGLGAAAIRNVLRIVDQLPFAYLIGIALILMNDDEQRVGDMAASTYVVKG